MSLNPPLSADEHPFAPFVRALGKGPNLSRPLTQAEAAQALDMVFAGQVEPVQLGAFLCLLRVKTETPGEIAGMAEACRRTVTLPAPLGAAVDWPAWAGKSRHYPRFILAALALAASGVPIFMHGAEDHTEGRLYASRALAALGIPVAASGEDAVSKLKSCGFAYMTLDILSPPMARLMELRRLLGLRSPIHTIGRLLNPSQAPFSLSSVTHPPYLALHRDAAHLLGQSRMASFKGEGGEAERRPEKSCEIQFIMDGQPGAEEWPPLCAQARPHEESLDPARLPELWADDKADPAIIGTMAIVLRYSGRAPSIETALELATSMWRNRPQNAARSFGNPMPVDRQN